MRRQLLLTLRVQTAWWNLLNSRIKEVPKTGNPTKSGSKLMMPLKKRTISLTSTLKRLLRTRWLLSIISINGRVKRTIWNKWVKCSLRSIAMAKLLTSWLLDSEIGSSSLIQTCMEGFWGAVRSLKGEENTLRNRGKGYLKLRGRVGGVNLRKTWGLTNLLSRIAGWACLVGLIADRAISHKSAKLLWRRKSWSKCHTKTLYQWGLGTLINN